MWRIVQLCSTPAAGRKQPGCSSANIVTARTEEFLTALRAGCRRVGSPSGRWLVAVSGGADSVALLRGLAELRTELQFELIVGHFDHRLRGNESAQDAEWVRQLAESLDLPHCAGASNTGAPVGTAFDENTARKQRYDFLV